MIFRKPLVILVVIFFLGAFGKSIYVETMAFITHDCSWYQRVGDDQIEANSYSSKYTYCKVQKILDDSSTEAKYDFVGNINFDGLSYSEFPYLDCSPGLIVSGYQKKECKDTSKQKYIDNFKYPDIPLKKTSYGDNYYEVLISDSKTNFFDIGRSFSIEGYRDVNNDGYMDIVIVVKEMTGGTMLIMSNVVLTRFSKNGKLKIINNWD
jgi:hypothetical protein